MRAIIGINTDWTDEGTTPRYAANADYAEAVAEAGGIPWLAPCVADTGLAAELVAAVDGFVFVGGPDYSPLLFGQPLDPRTRLMEPRRAAMDFALARAALARGVPILGVCAGCQLLAVASGGQLIQHLPTADAHAGEKSHPVRVVAEGRLSAALGRGPFTVNSTHHQAVSSDAPGHGLRVTALADDGVVEAVEADDGRFVLGVQWHPERIADAAHRRALFGAFVVAAAARRGGRQPADRAPVPGRG
jgi:putative glutamine amidotransferase